MITNFSFLGISKKSAKKWYDFALLIKGYDLNYSLPAIVYKKLWLRPQKI